MLFTHEGRLTRHIRAPKHQRQARASAEKLGRIRRRKKGSDGPRMAPTRLALLTRLTSAAQSCPGAQYWRLRGPCCGGRGGVSGPPSSCRRRQAALKYAGRPRAMTRDWSVALRVWRGTNEAPKGSGLDVLQQHVHHADHRQVVRRGLRTRTGLRAAGLAGRHAQVGSASDSGARAARFAGRSAGAGGEGRGQGSPPPRRRGQRARGRGTSPLATGSWFGVWVSDWPGWRRPRRWCRAS